MDTNENRLIKGLIANDREIIQFILTSLQPQVNRFLLKQGCPESQLEDVFYRSLEILLLKARQDNFRLTSKVSTYLIGIAYNLWRKARQKASRVQIMADLPEGLDEAEIQAISTKQERLDFIWEKIAALTKGCQEILRLVYREGKSMQEIAAAFQLASTTTARVKKHRCEDQLKILIQGDARFTELGF